MISPCVQKCKLDITKTHCVSCKRTRVEIMTWREMTDTQRQDVMDELPNRPVGSPS